VHDANPAARSALEGTQPMGWGGYDWPRLAPSADLFEIYDFFGSLAMVQSFAPHAVLLTTTFEAPDEVRSLWREALRGTSGTVIWDDPSIVGADGRPSARGTLLAPSFHALTGALGRRLIAAPEPTAPVGILVSQESFRLAWLLARRAEKGVPGGKGDWAQRTSGDEDGDDTPLRRALSALLQDLATRGLRPVMLTDAMVAQGGLRGLRVLAMPRVLALSDAAAAAIRGFAETGGTVAADTVPGAYDIGGRRRAAPLLAGMKLAPLGDVAGKLTPPVEVLDGATPAADVEVHVRHEGAGLLVSVQATADATRRLTLSVPGSRSPWARRCRRSSRCADAGSATGDTPGRCRSPGSRSRRRAGSAAASPATQAAPPDNSNRRNRTPWHRASPCCRAGGPVPASRRRG
jgi:hypothetical protein